MAHAVDKDDYVYDTSDESDTSSKSNATSTSDIASKSDASSISNVDTDSEALENDGDTDSEALENNGDTDSDVLENNGDTDSDVLENNGDTDSDVFENNEDTDSEALENNGDTNSDVLENNGDTDSDVFENNEDTDSEAVENDEMPENESNTRCVRHKTLNIGENFGSETESETESENSFELIDEPKQNIEEPEILQDNAQEEQEEEEPKGDFFHEHFDETIPITDAEFLFSSGISKKELKLVFKRLIEENKMLKKESDDYKTKCKVLRRELKKSQLNEFNISCDILRLKEQNLESILFDSEDEGTNKQSSMKKHKRQSIPKPIIQSQTEVVENNDEIKIDSNNQSKTSAAPNNSNETENNSNNQKNVNELKQALKEISKNSQHYHTLVIQIQYLIDEIESYKVRNQMIMVHDGIDKVLDAKLSLLYHSSIVSKDSVQDVLRLKSIIQNYNGVITEEDRDYLCVYLSSIYPHFKLVSKKIWETSRLAENRLIDILLYQSLQICTNSKHYSLNKENEKNERLVENLRGQLLEKGKLYEKERYDNQALRVQYEHVSMMNETMSKEIDSLRKHMEDQYGFKLCQHCNKFHHDNVKHGTEYCIKSTPTSPQQLVYLPPSPNSLFSKLVREPKNFSH